MSDYHLAMFNIAVIGKGMIGAAAGKYVSEEIDKVALIGPDEPANWKTHTGVFASHYDQGRITRVLDLDPVWAKLAKLSIETYPDIEQKSGVHFHHQTGGLRASVHNHQFIDDIRGVGESLQADFAPVTAGQLQEELPFFDFPDDTSILWEREPAGYVNPRDLVNAQVTIAGQKGATIIRETAISLNRSATGWEIFTDSGQAIEAKKVLLSAGAFTNLLLPNRPLALRRKAHMILLARLPQAEIDRLQGMPTLIYQLPKGSAVPNIYMLPPVRYPDGHTYIKLGGGTHWPETNFAAWHEITQWFHSDGDAKEGEALQSALHQVLPNLQVEAYQTKPCILTYTDHDHPYIGELEDGLFVVTGGCGAAAKSSDAVGRLGALTALEIPWPEAFDPADFMPVFA